MSEVGSTISRTVRAFLTGPSSRSPILLAGGVLIVTIAGTFSIIPMVLSVSPMNRRVAVGLAAVGAVMILLAVSSLRRHAIASESQADAEQEPTRSTELYGMYLVGLGFALLTMALVCSIVFGGVAWSVASIVGGAPGPAVNTQAVMKRVPTELGQLFGDSPDDVAFILCLFVISSIVAMLGALFFFCTSLWTKMAEPERERFDRRMFWGGLWFRLGEALLFNLVFFLLLRTYAPDRFLLLPLVSLFVGMFLKTGESLVAGIATRVFASIQALVPTDLKAGKTMKLLVLALDPVESSTPADAVKAGMGQLAAAVKGLAGVEQVETDDDRRTLRVEYNASAVTPDDILRKVALKGFRLRPAS